MAKRIRGLSLIELLVSMILMSLVLLGFFSIDLFSRHHVVSSDRRAKVQNEIVRSLEYMSKYVQQSIGDFNNPPIKAYPAVVGQTGFQVRVDLNTPQTPGNLADDTWVIFYLDTNSLKTQTGGATEVLSSRIISNFATNVMPETPDKGFYVSITDQGTAVDIGLVGRYDPTTASTTDNPQLSMKTRLICPSSSAR